MWTDPGGNSDLFLILGCMTSLCSLVLYIWRTDTIVSSKFNKPPVSIKPPSPPPSNGLETNKKFAVMLVTLGTVVNQATLRRMDTSITKTDSHSTKTHGHLHNKNRQSQY